MQVYSEHCQVAKLQVRSDLTGRELNRAWNILRGSCFDLHAHTRIADLAKSNGFVSLRESPDEVAIQGLANLLGMRAWVLPSNRPGLNSTLRTPSALASQRRLQEMSSGRCYPLQRMLVFRFHNYFRSKGGHLRSYQLKISGHEDTMPCKGCSWTHPPPSVLDFAVLQAAQNHDIPC